MPHDRDTRAVTLDNPRVMDLITGWWGSQDDPLYAIHSMGGTHEAWVFQDAIANLDAMLASVKKVGSKYQLGKGTYSKKEIDELRTIRDALARALKSRPLDEFARAYVEAALWSSTDNSDDQGGDPLDQNYGIDDIAPETMELMVEDCADFQTRYAKLLADSGIADSRAGHDFWLSRNGHGSGFFDEDTIDEEFQDPLQDAARSYGEFDLYVGDPDADGERLIYGPPPDWYRSHRKPAPAVSEARRPALRAGSSLDRDKIQRALKLLHRLERHTLNPNGLSRAAAASEAIRQEGLNPVETDILLNSVHVKRSEIDGVHERAYRPVARSTPRPHYAGEARGRRTVRDLPDKNVFWRSIPSGSTVKLVGHSYVVTLPDGSRASAYWGGQDARAAQDYLDSLVRRDTRPVPSHPERHPRSPGRR